MSKSAAKQRLTKLPKVIRDELRMCVALRGYSTIRSGEGKTLDEQYRLMEEFYHGKKNSSPSQIEMLVEGQLHYAGLYEKKPLRITSKKHRTKKNKENTDQYYLKDSLSRDKSRKYIQKVDITVKDLEKKLRTGKAILHGRQLESMAKKGLRAYRKALSFTKDKWDLKLNVPKESGTTVDDVIDYVRLKMYNMSKSTVVIDDDDDDDVVNAFDEETTARNNRLINDNNNDDNTEDVSEANDSVIIKDINDNKNNTLDSDVIVNVDSNLDDKNDEVVDNIVVETEQDSYKKMHDSNDGDSSYNSSESDDSDDSDDESELKDPEQIPENYMFASFIAFVLWGPFADESHKLPLLLLSDADKRTVMPRAQRRKEAMKQKSLERDDSTTEVRGFSTDQRINIQALNINKNRLDHQKNQTYLVGLSIQESAMSRQVRQCENRAANRCPVYDSENIHWKVADDLIEKHNELVLSIRTKTEELFNNNNSSKQLDDDNEVGEFLQQTSPVKKSVKRVITEVDFDDDDNVQSFTSKLSKTNNIEIDAEFENENAEERTENNEEDDEGVEVKKELISVSKQKLIPKTISKAKVRTMPRRKGK